MMMILMMMVMVTWKDAAVPWFFYQPLPGQAKENEDSL